MKVCLLVILVAVGLELSLGAPGKKAVLLPPPDEGDEETGADGEPIRGIKGLAGQQAMGQVQKSTKACEHVGSDPIKDECSKYIECSRVGGLPQTKFCIQGKFFDHKKRMCIKTSDAQCRGVCPTDGPKFPDPNNEHGFLKCTKGIPVRMNCKKPSMTWETSINRCKE